MNSERAQHRGKGIHKKIEVFECSENGKIQYQREDEPFAAAGVAGFGSNSLRDEEIDQRAANHEREKAPVPPTVKEIAGTQQEDVLLSAAQTPVNEHDGNQK